MNNLDTFLNLNKPILITGPTGTGKSFLAKKIYEDAKIFKRSFLTLHLASIKEELIESELFGHKKGAFTGATENKIGYLEAANNGTLFLDEIGELSLEAQKKLLFLLEEKKFNVVGDTKTQSFNGRLIMATNCNLLEMVKAKTFREDLYYRLSTFELKLEPITYDKSKLKIAILNEQIRANEEFSKNYKLTTDLFEQMINYSWPGNYRELKNTMDFLVVTGEKSDPKFEQLAQCAQKKNSGIEDLFLRDFHQSVELFESMYLKHVLEKNQGKINETARQIGLSKAALIYKSKKYLINTWKIKANHYQLPSEMAA